MLRIDLQIAFEMISIVFADLGALGNNLCHILARFMIFLLTVLNNAIIAISLVDCKYNFCLAPRKEICFTFLGYGPFSLSLLPNVIVYGQPRS